MKIRIKGNMIRFRLSKTEVEQFAATGSLAERTEFGPGKYLEYALRTDAIIQTIRITFEENSITLFIPETERVKWTSTNLVGLQETIEIEKGKSLHVLLEKDFKCLDNTIEDQSDNYPNPLIANYIKI